MTTRDIKTVTYLVEGEIEHVDSLGNKGTIRSGDCRWMTAGPGIIHSEMPLGEPVAWGGPIVMNTEQELEEAYIELNNGTFIKDAATV